MFGNEANLGITAGLKPEIRAACQRFRRLAELNILVRAGNGRPIVPDSQPPKSHLGRFNPGLYLRECQPIRDSIERDSLLGLERQRHSDFTHGKISNFENIRLVI
jgi:hypothetical protein